LFKNFWQIIAQSAKNIFKLDMITINLSKSLS